MNLYRTTLIYGGCFPKPNRTLYVVAESKEAAERTANERTKDGYTVSKVAYLAESLNYGNTLFLKEGRL